MASFSPRVLVTGGGLGIGFATVEFLLNKYNARVVVLTLDYGSEFEELLRKYESEKRLFVRKGDVTSVEDTEDAVAIASEQFGGLDGLVVSAGIEPAPTRILDLPYETFVRTLNTNVCGTFLSVQKCLPLLHQPAISRPADHSARIVILTSTADGGLYAGRSAYISSKAAQTRFIDNLVNEERDTGVDIYGIYPGFTRTGMAEPMIQGTYHHVMFPEEKAKYLAWIAKGAIEGPEWCGEACAQLSVGAAPGLKGKTTYYSVHVPEFRHGDVMSSRLQIAPA